MIQQVVQSPEEIHDMQVTVSGDHHNTVVSVDGDVDAYSSPALALAIEKVAADGVDVLTLDLSGVAFLGSAGLSVLIGAQRSVKKFHLLRGNRIVDRLVTLTGLELLYGSDESSDTTDTVTA
jgi:anti-sigma B factor antagonist